MADDDVVGKRQEFSQFLPPRNSCAANSKLQNSQTQNAVGTKRIYRIELFVKRRRREKNVGNEAKPIRNPRGEQETEELY